ncbi:MAG: hypothetical protein MHPSP_001005 [Paramarteilia canceri]
MAVTRGFILKMMLTKTTLTRRTNELPADVDTCARNCALKSLTADPVILQAIQNILQSQQTQE